MREEYKGFGEDMGGGCWSVHRADLHSGLRELVGVATLSGKTLAERGTTMEDNEGDNDRNETVDGGPVRIELGREVVGLDCEAGVIEFKDGTRLEGWDLVVVADGAHVRSCVFL